MNQLDELPKRVFLVSTLLLSFIPPLSTGFAQGTGLGRLTDKVDQQTAELVLVADALGSNHSAAVNKALTDGAAASKLAAPDKGNVSIPGPGSLSFGTATRQMLNLWGTYYGIGVQARTHYSRTEHGFAWFKKGSHSDAELDPGDGTELMRLSEHGSLHLSGPGNELSLRNRDSASVHVQRPVSGERWVLYSRTQGGSGRLFFWSGSDKASIDTAGNLHTTGAVNPPSDRNVKAGFELVDPKSILEKVAALPITRWHYTNDAATPHLGPVAQDFHAAFGVGADDKHIATVDADGVALAAVQGLNQRLTEELARRDAENADLKQELSELKKVVRSLVSRLKADTE